MKQVITARQWKQLCDHQRMLDSQLSPLFLAFKEHIVKRRPKKKPKVPGGY